MRPERFSKLGATWMLGLALLSLPIGRPSAAADPRTSTPHPTRRSPIIADLDLQFPIQVRIQPLDPVRRGQAVRLRLDATSRVGLRDSEARIVSAGGATVVGRPRATLGALSRQREASADFVVRLPEAGDRFLVQFRVEGEGTAGRIGRGATFNLLPDGPATPTRVVTGGSGQSVAEYPARRMP